MKILMLGWELPPYNSGGLGVACYKLCKALAAYGVEIDFAVPYAAVHDNIDFMRVIPALPYSIEELRTFAGAYESGSFTTTVFAQPSAHSAHLPRTLREQQARFTEAVQGIAAKGNYDMIHAHDWLTYEAAIAAKKELAVPVIAHVHATEFDRSGEHHGNPLVHEIEQQGLNLADHVVAVSQLTKDIIVREYGLPADKVTVVHNAIDPQDFEPVSSANAYAYLAHMKAKGYKVVLSTNRFTVQKGMTYFLRAARDALSKNPKLLFLLCGSGEQYHELIELSTSLGIAENVIFSGFVRGKALRDAYEMADMFVMSSVSEPFGISALEAVGYGNVTLVSKQSGICEVVKNILTFDYWDVPKLANYIVATAEHESLRTTLKANARDEFQHFSWHTVAEKCQRLYDEQNYLAKVGVV
ncbi:MAG TPA: glycosyltransferase family 4 protein [Candidatus Saccharimonadales bacterium]|nr:glycosyltransferase family 4 protein [Candidatus Saccharimonadales bacterium]